MRIKITTFLLVLIFSQNFYSQITITEIYYDTPDNEKLRFIKKVNGLATQEEIEAVKHHRGEFIEIYNYSDKDVNLKDWFIKDLQGVFWFPDKVIKSKQFMLIAYSVLPYNTTPFSECFTTTIGKESQIILQDKIILRNQREIVSLGRVYNFGGTPFTFNKAERRWEFRQSPPINFIGEIWRTPNKFYEVNSIQYNPNYTGNQDNPDLYDNYMAAPNPLDATYKPPTESYDQIIYDDYNSYYSYLDWTDNVNALIDNKCSISILNEEQTAANPGTNVFKCFNHDTSGNLTSSYNCNSTPSTTPSTDYTYDELEEIKKVITIAPNPTNSVVTISWSGVALGKVTNLQVHSSTGGLIYNYSPSSTTNSVTINLQNQISGVYIAHFYLNTGQLVSKNILKW